MFKFSQYYLLPIMLVNLTIAENLWEILGFPIDLGLYVVTIILACYVGMVSPYRQVVIFMICVSITCRLFWLIVGIEFAYLASLLSFSIIFMITGVMLYGRNPYFLHKQLIIYLGLSLPIMLLQILGLSSFIMGWNTGYLHDPLIFSVEDIGTFKEFDLYPTLFVGIHDLNFSYGQARPVGLMYGSNPLSIFVCFAIALNLTICRSKFINSSDIILTVVTVLLMSKMAFVIAFMLYFGALIAWPAKRALTLRLIALFIFILLLYYILFPGLFIYSFSEGIVMEAIALRLFDILRALGVDGLYAIFGGEWDPYYERIVIKGQSYSIISILIKSKTMSYLFFVGIVVGVFYVLRLRMMVRSLREVMVYLSVLLVCVITQFAVPFVTASSFQLIFGFGMYPLFKKIWRSNPTSQVYRK